MSFQSTLDLTRSGFFDRSGVKRPREEDSFTDQMEIDRPWKKRCFDLTEEDDTVESSDFSYSFEMDSSSRSWENSEPWGDFNFSENDKIDNSFK